MNLDLDLEVVHRRMLHIQDLLADQEILDHVPSLVQ